MKQNYLKGLLFMLICIYSLSIWSQRVTLDFTTNSWGLPVGSSNKGTTQASFTSGGYTIKVTAGTGYYFSTYNESSYLILGKANSTLELPVFDFAVGKIEVYGTTGASASVVQNIYVGSTAVSSPTTGAKFDEPTNQCNTYIINSNNQSIGTVYTFKVTSSHNTQITAIKIYEAQTGTPDVPTFSVSSGSYNSVQTVELTTTTEGAEIRYTLDGTEPNASSTLYSSPLSISETTTVKAVAVKNGVLSTVASATYTIVTTLGQGTFENPYTVDDVKKLNNPGTKAWVSGPIYGIFKSISGNSVPSEEVGTTATNIALGSGEDIIPVALPFGEVRTSLNLVDNPSLQGQIIKVYGELAAYFTTTGVKNTSAYDSPLCNLKITESKYATYYNSTKAYTLPANMEGYIWTDRLEQKYYAGDVVPAGVALVLKADAGNYTLNFTTGPTVGAGNKLLGTDTETALTADADYYFYGLSLNADGETSSVGFYWMAADGAAFTNGAHKAYLKLPKSSGVKCFLFETENADAIQNVATETENKVIYNLAGQRVNKAQKGLYIVNGKKVMY